MVLTASFVLSPVTGLPHSGGLFSLSARIAEAFGLYTFYPIFGEREKCWITGPHDFAVRSNISRQRAGDRSRARKNPPCDPLARKTLPRPPHPAPRP